MAGNLAYKRTSMEIESVLKTPLALSRALSLLELFQYGKMWLLIYSCSHTGSDGDFRNRKKTPLNIPMHFGQVTMEGVYIYYHIIV